MRGRILWAVTIAAVLLAGCGKRDSLYIEPGKAGPAAAPQKAQPAKPAPRTPKS
jgi:predicted small lipoprotein YifL